MARGSSQRKQLCWLLSPVQICFHILISGSIERQELHSAVWNRVYSIEMLKGAFKLSTLPTLSLNLVYQN